MRPGAIAVEHAARSFRVYPRENRALKDLLFARRHARGSDVWALRDVSFDVEPGSAVGLVGRNGSGKTTLLRLLSGIVKPSSGHVAVGGRIGSLLELGAGFHPDLTGRENVYLNGSIHGLRRVAIREKLDEIVAFAGLEEFIDLPVRTYSSGMYMRLGFAIAAHIEADVLLLDEVFAVGDEAFQRKCFGKIFEFKQRGGTIVFVSHDAAAVDQLCDRAVLLKDGSVIFDGPTHDAIVAYRRQLAGERNPEERAAGLKEWGGDTTRIDRVRLLGPEGDERTQLLSGEPFSIALDVVSDVSVEPPRLGWELRDDAAILVAAGAVSTGELGWNAETRRLPLRFDAERPPFADGRLHLRADLTDERGEAQYHSVDDALVVVIYPSDDSRGLVRLEGRWAAAAELERTT
ncbi:MAG: lipopolysaccharide transport system ATP-binding protein [Gaiellaceae bacterium]|jgi:ABC-type polysaccharide/polyol phosphate transport system ATPase subunit|nr:lipopolysaccharide transport system ATP-binding protein [Gaiellaceae bacterium]